MRSALQSAQPRSSASLLRSGGGGPARAACPPPRLRLQRVCASKHGLQAPQPQPREPARRAPQPQPQPRQGLQLPRLLAGCAAAAAGLLAPLLPSWAFDSYEYMTDAGLDPGLGDAPQVMDTLLVVVVTYLTVMMLYLWLSSFMAGDEGGAKDGDAGGGGAPPDGSELPPGYNSFLDAHVRSYVNPESQHVTALRDLGQAQPLEGEDLERLKHRLAAGAAEALEAQLRDCERLVHGKLLARKMGYHPARAPAGAAGGSGGASSSGGGGTAGPGSGAHLTREDIGALMTTAVMTAPGGLASWQHRAAVEALIDSELDDLLPPGGGRYQEDLVVRQVMRRVVQQLVMEESLLLLEGTQQGKQALEAGRRSGKGGPGRGEQPSWWPR